MVRLRIILRSRGTCFSGELIATSSRNAESDLMK